MCPRPGKFIWILLLCRERTGDTVHLCPGHGPARGGSVRLDQGYSGLEGHRTSPGTCKGCSQPRRSGRRVVQSLRGLDERPIARLPQCDENAQCQNVNKGDFPRGPMAKTSHSQCRGPGSIPGQGPRAHVPQLRPSPATINKYKFFFNVDRGQTTQGGPRLLPKS